MPFLKYGKHLFLITAVLKRTMYTKFITLLEELEFALGTNYSIRIQL